MLADFCLYPDSNIPEGPTYGKYELNTDVWGVFLPSSCGTMTAVATFYKISENRFRTYIILKQQSLKPEIDDSRGVVVSYKRKNVHEALVNSLVNLVQEKKIVVM